MLPRVLAVIQVLLAIYLLLCCFKVLKCDQKRLHCTSAILLLLITLTNPMLGLPM